MEAICQYIVSFSGIEGCIQFYSRHLFTPKSQMSGRFAANSYHCWGHLHCGLSRHIWQFIIPEKRLQSKQKKVQTFKAVVKWPFFLCGLLTLLHPYECYELATMLNNNFDYILSKLRQRNCFNRNDDHGDHRLIWWSNQTLSFKFKCIYYFF